MTRFFIAPYAPNENPDEWEALSSASTLKIDADAYEHDLRTRWPDINILSTSEKLLLQWEIREPGKSEGMISGTIAALHGDRQVVSMDTPYEEFILWHRKVIPSEHSLYLFNDSSWENLELMSHTSLIEIRIFLGGSPINGDYSS